MSCSPPAISDRHSSNKCSYCSPERLIHEGFIDQMRRTRIHMIAIDEAHCVPEWGNSFRPEYLKGLLVSAGMPVPEANLALVGS